MTALILVCLAYVVLLFAVAFFADRIARSGRGRWIRSVWVYTLSLSVYCTAWTFYGAVGYAARSGLEFVTIYLGPTLVMLGWWWGLRKLVRIGKMQKVTSVADFVSARYGRSNALAAAVTVLAVVGVTPYISLQLQSITVSFSIFASAESSALPGRPGETGALWVAAGLAGFAILFGTRNLDANERHYGVVTAIALEAIVKLVALFCVGIFVVWGVSGGIGPMLAALDVSPIGHWQARPERWLSFTLLSAAAFLCLPRMFQVMIVENEDERHLRIAAWAFPVYLLLISLFVVPIAVIGLKLLPSDVNPDLYVLAIPLHLGRDGLAMLSFLGGFSAATSMVIVAAMALSIMVSNHIVMPVYLARHSGASVSGDIRKVVLLARRVSIAAIMGLGYLYFRLSGGGAALAAIGLIAFSGIAQILPAMVGGIFWRGATRVGALAGLLTGFALWTYTLLLPGVAGSLMHPDILAEGPFGLGWLRPQALFGIEGLDPIVHATLWSLSLNILVFCIGSLLSHSTLEERVLGAQFVDVFGRTSSLHGWSDSAVPSEDLMIMVQRLLGADRARRLFADEALRQGRSSPNALPDPAPSFMQRLEREMAGVVGAATAHAMVGQIAGNSLVSVDDLIAVADESAQLLEYSSRLEAQSRELAVVARELRNANEKLTRVSRQKDAFLGQISHELRTPMTSIRAFSEILRDTDNLDSQEQRRFAGVIHDEALRLTRLLDDLLDLSVLESGKLSLDLVHGELSEVIDKALHSALSSRDDDIRIRCQGQTGPLSIHTDLGRLGQVFINLISNFRKYCVGANPELRIVVQCTEGMVNIDFIDNGPGVPKEEREIIFEKFARVAPERAGGAGLGLAICREIMHRLGGEIRYLPGFDGGAFRVSLPLNASRS